MEKILAIKAHIRKLFLDMERHEENAVSWRLANLALQHAQRDLRRHEAKICNPF
jgi:hypothetical protein